MTRDSNVSKPLKEDYIIRIKSRIEQHIDVCDGGPCIFSYFSSPWMISPK